MQARNALHPPRRWSACQGCPLATHSSAATPSLVVTKPDQHPLHSTKRTRSHLVPKTHSFHSAHVSHQATSAIQSDTTRKTRRVNVFPAVVRVWRAKGLPSVRFSCRAYRVCLWHTSPSQLPASHSGVSSGGDPARSAMSGTESDDDCLADLLGDDSEEERGPERSPVETGEAQSQATPQADPERSRDTGKAQRIEGVETTHEEALSCPAPPAASGGPADTAQVHPRPVGAENDSDHANGSTSTAPTKAPAPLRGDPEEDVMASLAALRAAAIASVQRPSRPAPSPERRQQRHEPRARARGGHRRGGRPQAERHRDVSDHSRGQSSGRSRPHARQGGRYGAPPPAAKHTLRQAAAAADAAQYAGPPQAGGHRHASAWRGASRSPPPSRAGAPRRQSQPAEPRRRLVVVKRGQQGS